MKQVAIITVTIMITTLLAGSCIMIDNVWIDDRETFKVTDMFDREVNIPVNVERVIAAGATALRFVTYLDGSSKVVGVEDFEKDTSVKGLGGRTYAIAHPEYAELPSIGNQHGGNEELMSFAGPDVVFFSTQESHLCDHLQSKLGIPVVGLSSGVDLTTNIESFYRQIDLIGKILNNEKRADYLKTEIDTLIHDIQSRATRALEKDVPTVYIGGLSYGGSRGLYSTSAHYAPFIFLNANNIIKTASSVVVDVDKEALVGGNPDYIFLDRAGLPSAVIDYRNNRPALNDMAAFKNDSIYGMMQSNWYATNWDTVLISCYYVGKIIYPDEFDDVVMEKKAEEIYTMMLGVNVYQEVSENVGGFGQLSLA